MEEIDKKLRAGMERQGVTGETAEAIIRSITAFALYGFPEAHAASFALIAYASAYLKVHYPAAFYAALLNNQPMGFYHPAAIVRDAARHGQAICPVDVNVSGWLCSIEPDGTVRLGLRYARGLREEAGRLIERERTRRPFASVDDLVKRAGLHHDELARLARLGVARAADLAGLKNGAWVQVAGAVVVRQRPGTAKGFVFLSLEDETGLANVIVRPALFQRYRLTLVGEPFLRVAGTLQHQDGVISVRAERLAPLGHGLAGVPSHDFR